MATDNTNTPAANMPSAAEMARILNQPQAQTATGETDVGYLPNIALAAAKKVGLSDRKGFFALDTPGFGAMLGANKQGLPDTFGKSKNFFQKNWTRLDPEQVAKNFAGLQGLNIEPVSWGTGGMPPPDSGVHIQAAQIQQPTISEPSSTGHSNHWTTSFTR